MKIVVVGGTGLIGSRVVARLRERGHEALAASPASGVNAVTGEGIAEALAGADVVVDVSNSPSFEPRAAMDFFTRSTLTLLAAEKPAGIEHHVVLSVVGTDRLASDGYFRAKAAQEALLEQSSVPFSIVHATQFFEFLRSIAQSGVDGDVVRLPPVLFQPVAADDVASEVAAIAAGRPLNGTVELGGPEAFRLDALVGRYLREQDDARTVIGDETARYFGVPVSERTLLPASGAKLGEIRFDDWIRVQSPRQAAPGGAQASGASKGSVAGTQGA